MPKVFDSSTVMTPSLPTLSIASAMASPTVVSPPAEMVAVAAICSRVSTSLAICSSWAETASTADSMPRLSAIGLAPAATLRRPSRTMAWARTVAVVVPSPATSSVFLATSLTSSAPIFSYGSSSSISLAMETPSLVMVGAPHFFSRTTLRPFGPRVTLTASARVFIPRSRPRRASSLKAMSFDMAPAIPHSMSSGGPARRPRRTIPRGRRNPSPRAEDLDEPVLGSHSPTESARASLARGRRECRTSGPPVGEGPGQPRTHVEVEPRLDQLELPDHPPTLVLEQVDPGVVETPAVGALDVGEDHRRTRGGLRIEVDRGAGAAVLLVHADLLAGGDLADLALRPTAQDEPRVLPHRADRLDQRLHDPRSGQQRGLVEVVGATRDAVEDHDAAPAGTHRRLHHGLLVGRDRRRELALVLRDQGRHDGQTGRVELGEVALVGVPGEDLRAVEQPVADRVGDAPRPAEELGGALVVVPGAADRH